MNAAQDRGRDGAFKTPVSRTPAFKMPVSSAAAGGMNAAAGGMNAEAGGMNAAAGEMNAAAPAYACGSRLRMRLLLTAHVWGRLP